MISIARLPVSIIRSKGASHAIHKKRSNKKKKKKEKERSHSRIKRQFPSVGDESPNLHALSDSSPSMKLFLVVEYRVGKSVDGGRNIWTKLITCAAFFFVSWQREREREREKKRKHLQDLLSTILLEPLHTYHPFWSLKTTLANKNRPSLFPFLISNGRWVDELPRVFFQHQHQPPTICYVIPHTVARMDVSYCCGVRSRVLPRLKTPRFCSSFLLSLSLSSVGFYEGFKSRPGQTRNEGHVDGWRTSTMLSPLFHSILLRETYLFPDKYFPFEFQVCCSHSLSSGLLS